MSTAHEVESSKPVKDHPKVLAKKSSAEYLQKEQNEQQQQQSSDAVNAETTETVPPPEEETVEEKPFQLPADFTLGSSHLMQTPFKTDLAIFQSLRGC